MNKQSKALRLAERLLQRSAEVRDSDGDMVYVVLTMTEAHKAAAELRRLHEEVEMQLQALKAARQLMESAYQLSKKDQALLRQALEALELLKRSPNMGIWCDTADSAITAIRQHLGETK